MSWKTDIETIERLQKKLADVTMERDELKARVDKQHEALVKFRKAFWEADRNLLAGFYEGPLTMKQE